MKKLCYAMTIALAATTAVEAKGPSNDQMFVTKAAQGGMTEVELGKLASAQGHSDAVKEFGDRMATDHGKANDALKKAASDDSLNVPSEISAKQQAVVSKMKGMQGEAFDKAYTSAMLKDHKDTIALFKKEAKSGKSSDVKSFAETTLPTLEEHLTLAKELNSSKK